MAEVSAGEDESFDSLLKRFNRKVQQDGILAALVFAVCSEDLGTAKTISGISADLDLQLPGSPFFFKRHVLCRRD